MSEQVYGHIYLIKNLQTNKIYIGQTINLKERINSHFHKIKRVNTYIAKTIHKYGKHNFKLIILGECSSKQELDEAEKECIKFFESNNSIYGYNLTEGGNNTLPSFLGKKHSEETKKKMSEAGSKRKHSEETKKKMSDAQQNRPKELEQQRRQKISSSKKGKKRICKIKTT